MINQDGKITTVVSGPLFPLKYQDARQVTGEVFLNRRTSAGCRSSSGDFISNKNSGDKIKKPRHLEEAGVYD